MNQDQLKKLLIQIEEPGVDFSLIFSGKESKKVDGLYRPESMEIVIHNRNMERDDELIYTGIHEYAHHLNAVRNGQTGRAHSRRFWAEFHRLLGRAEELGLYRNPIQTDPDLNRLAETIRTTFMREEGERMLAFGKLLLEAHEICRSRRYSFDDFVDRELGLHHSTAKILIRSTSEDVPVDLGYENAKGLLRIKAPEERMQAAARLRRGESPDMVYQAFAPRSEAKPVSELKDLRTEKRRIVRSLEKLQQRLEEIDRRLAGLEDDQP